MYHKTCSKQQVRCVFLCVVLLLCIYFTVHTLLLYFIVFYFYNRKLSCILAKALLWGYFDPSTKQCIYSPTMAYIQGDYSELLGTELSDATEKPIVCVFLLVTGNKDNLQITESFVERNGIIGESTLMRTYRLVRFICNVFFKLSNLPLSIVLCLSKNNTGNIPSFSESVTNRPLMKIIQ